MSFFTKQCQAYAERSIASQAAAAAAQVEAGRATAARVARERLSPLEDRLARLLATIPAEVQREGLSLPELLPRLKGRFRATADCGQTGTALRKLGWKRERRWRGGDIGFKALWLPPSDAA